ncbi:hypothetical protein [Candidatus Tisiphia endosymbiont of Hybos culiciformis]|uniref:hypothetical protein n=1 Tax=Candidatus Tisiphia endosymbiont of Hybos culiciformis TaxID=3139331 RepID=UPI003CCABB15
MVDLANTKVKLENKANEQQKATIQEFNNKLKEFTNKDFLEKIKDIIEQESNVENLIEQQYAAILQGVVTDLALQDYV